MENRIDISKLAMAGLTLTGCKLALDKAYAEVSPLGMTLICVLWQLGDRSKHFVKELVPREYSTVSHAIKAMLDEGYIGQSVRLDGKRKVAYLFITKKGAAAHARFLRYAAEFTEKLNLLMPQTMPQQPSTES